MIIKLFTHISFNLNCTITFDKNQQKSDKRYKKWNKMQIKENTLLFQFFLYAENNINNSFDFKWEKSYNKNKDRSICTIYLKK